jgi:hypothetical protein
VARRAPLSDLEPENYSELSHGIYTVLPGLSAESVLPTDLEYGSLRPRAYSECNNQVNREDSLDQLDEVMSAP